VGFFPRPSSHDTNHSCCEHHHIPRRCCQRLFARPTFSSLCSSRSRPIALQGGHMTTSLSTPFLSCSLYSKDHAANLAASIPQGVICVKGEVIVVALQTLLSISHLAQDLTNRMLAQAALNIRLLMDSASYVSTSIQCAA
jgi:hypothetical protein